MTNITTKPVSIRRRRLALLLPAHNEELLIASTINSAVAAGQDIQDIYVVDDDSSDNTRKEALKLLPATHVLTVPRSGKALALRTAMDHFGIIKGYVWVHIADADSLFGPDYFHIFTSKLDAKKFAVAVGFVQSLRGNWISKYRAYCYTYGQHIFRRVQSTFNLIYVFPGAVTCFRTDIIPKLDFYSDSLTEDFDLTLQFHRKKLGKIRFIPRAINYTQDPQTFKDFYNQCLRWYRGFFQGVRKYRIGTKANKLDMLIVYLLLESFFYLAQMLILLPVVILLTHNWLLLGSIILIDFAASAVIAIVAATAIKRPMMLTALPIFYVLRMVELLILLQAFAEIMILNRFKTKVVGWQTEGRRYAVDKRAMQDISTK